MFLKNAIIRTSILCIWTALIAYFGGISNHNLSLNGNWKSLLDLVGVNSIAPIFSDPLLVQGNRLNLSLHRIDGYLWKEKIQPTQIEFDFRLGENGFFHLIYNLQNYDLTSPRSLIRISCNSDFPSAQIVAIDAYRFDFLNQIPLTLADICNEKKIHVLIRDNIIEIGDQKFRLNLKLQEGFFGFWGGISNASVDDLKITTLNGNIISESFSPKYKVIHSLLIAFILISLVFIAFKTRTKNILYETLTHITLMALIILAIPLAPKIFKRNEPIAISKDLREETITKEIKKRAEILQDDSLLILGASQAAGIMANKLEDTWDKKLQQLLMKSFAEIKIANFAISSLVIADINRLVIPLISENHKLKMALIDLGNNDCFEKTPIEFFSNAVLELEKRLNGKNIRPIWLVEPRFESNNPKSISGCLPYQNVIRQGGGERVVLNTHEFMNRKELSSRGILWWDHVHMTSYGQEIMANDLVYFVQDLLNQKKP